MQVRAPHIKKCGFTLAELLVVMAIIGLIFVIVLPSLNSITGQSKLDGAANAVHSAAKLARQYAVTHNQPTYLVFNEGQTGSNLANRAYAIFTINIHTNAVPVPQEAGYYLSAWESLPAGVVFDKQDTVSFNNIFTPYEQDWEAGFGLNRKIFIKTDAFVVLAFKPRGTNRRNLVNDIQLAEGEYVDGNLVRTSDAGMRVRVDGMGQSHITDMHYDENGQPQEFAR